MKDWCVLFFCASFFQCVAQKWIAAYDSCLKYQEKQLYRQAIPWADTALMQYQRAVSLRDTSYSNILSKQAENYFMIGMYDKSLSYARQDSQWIVDNLGKANVRYAKCINIIGLLHKQVGNYSAAEKLYMESKETVIRILGKENSFYASVCNNIGSLYEVQGKWHQAEEFYLESKAINEKLNGKQSRNYAVCCSNLAVLYQKYDRFAEAELLLKEALAIDKNINGVNSTSYLSSSMNLAVLYMRRGRYPEAEILFKEAIKAGEYVYGKDSPRYANILNNMASLYQFQGRYTEAMNLYQKALNIRLQKLGEKHPEYAISCINVASIHQKCGEHEKAENLLKKAINIYSNNKDNPSYPIACNNLAQCYVAQGKYVQAETLFKHVMNIYIKNSGKLSRNYANTCNDLAELYLMQGRLLEADYLYRLALEGFKKSVGTNSTSYIAVANNLAGLLTIQKKLFEAETLYKQVLIKKLDEITKNFRNLSETEKEKYIENNAEDIFNQFLAFSISRYVENPLIGIDAYYLIIQIKGLILNSMEKMRRQIFNGSEEVKKLYSEWKSARENYSKAVSQKIISNPDSLLEKVNELEKELALKSEAFAHTYMPKTVTWTDIRNKLKKGQAAVEIARVIVNKEHKYSNKDSVIYMAVIIKYGCMHPEILVIDKGETLEKKMIINYRRCVTTKVQDLESYNAFWKPLREKLKGIKTVYFSPDGVYHQINLNTLQNPDTKKYVFDEMQIINVTNTKDILNKNTYTTKNNCLIGNPKFDLQIKTQQENEKPKQERTFEGFLEGISQLEGAEKEVKKISEFLPRATTVIGADATEEYVKSLKNPHILHIATHGYFKKGYYQSSTQAMLNAGLLFAGVVDYDRMEIRPLDRDDGKLTAFEVMNMELDSTELVVLSACETGLGQASKEGVYGLQRAFKVAGAQSIIMSLWKVNDEATQLLMTKFYENWQKKGMSKRKAFETAQKDIRKQYKEPYYWGAFVMIE
ncbi:MAG: CHAT domain-containing tetratricopeptide repeat protein [Bacteroidia bacterium]|nr:CHAT domain-containing tetratricopeptide repeat protein [Bacteroidia bacterium]